MNNNDETNGGTYLIFIPSFHPFFIETHANYNVEFPIDGVVLIKQILSYTNDRLHRCQILHTKISSQK